MSTGYWQAKIWGLLHDPVLKALHSNTGRGGNSFWTKLRVMSEWVVNGWDPEKSGKKILKHIKLADYITSASDRSALGSLTNSVNYDKERLEITHLLSGAKQHLTIPDHDKLLQNRQPYLEEKENNLFEQIPLELRGDIAGDLHQTKKLFWWLWRCLPEATNRELGSDILYLMPAETRLPDASIWSHVSLTAAMAGALAGYNLTPDDIRNRWTSQKPLSHAYLVSFTFSPIQELIKASRKMRDFWAGSWILHYLSASVCWKLAQQYGPDIFIYPSLYQQPLIDHWLLQAYPDFYQWIEQPQNTQLLTAGFPNVLVLVLPKDKVTAAMQLAKSTLLEEWKRIGDLVFAELESRKWMAELTHDSRSWTSWLKSQWQTYWVGVPVGKEEESLTSMEIYDEGEDVAIPEEEDEEYAQTWREQQNQAYGLSGCKALFVKEELRFLKEAGKLRRKHYKKHPFSSNVGSWWNHIFDQTRLALSAVKNARTWEIPTAFGPRSTISGLGPVVHPDDKEKNDWITEGDTKKYWKRNAGLFDGIEQLNATETVKRGLHLILPELLNLNAADNSIDACYPDLTAGVAGYLKVNPKGTGHFNNACQEITQQYPWVEEVIKKMQNQWGIPWADDTGNYKYHPRLLNSGWLIEDAETDDIQKLDKNLQQEKDEKLKEIIRAKIHRLKQGYSAGINQIIQKYYPHNNPADWYVLAAGDGDGMGEWLKGTKLKPYEDYIPARLEVDPEINEAFNEFIRLGKRMGPSTHSALSRALLDFSNQLVPYLTEVRYAGRLIYSGGDDVLAYTNLWEWDNWLWDVRQCFRGAEDSKKEFESKGDYWHFQGSHSRMPSRPLFTMGSLATISFGVVIAHHSVPLAIALENLWAAEKEGAKKSKSSDGHQKNAVQVRVIYGNGNILKATTRFDIFHQWQLLLNLEVESSLFEQAANLLEQHPIPDCEAIQPWTVAFCSRRDQLKEDVDGKFQKALGEFLKNLWSVTPENQLKDTAREWLKLAAFLKRNRQIDIG